MNNWDVCAQSEIDRLIVLLSSLNSEEEILRFSIKKGYGPRKPFPPVFGQEDFGRGAKVPRVAQVDYGGADRTPKEVSNTPRHREGSIMGHFPPKKSLSKE